MDERLFLSVLMLLTGLMTLAVRNRPNPFVGVRFGYTYLSKRAWKRANTFAGAFSLISGLLMLTLYLLDFPKSVILAVFLCCVATMAVLTYRIAKREYEIEDLSTPVGRAEPMEFGSNRVLIVEIALILLYLALVAILWKELPEKMAIHFDLYGKPDNFVSKPLGSIAVPVSLMSLILLLTFLAEKEPLLLRFPSVRSRKILMITQAMLFLVFVSVLFYNVGFISGEFVVVLCFLAVGVVIASALRS